MEFYEEYWDNKPNWPRHDGSIHPIEMNLFRRYILDKPNKTVLDYGCGPAKRYGQYLTEHHVNYCGFDISAAAVRAANEVNLNVHQLTSDGETNLPSESVDVAICFEVFEHLLDPDKAIGEIRRCLKPSGFLICSVPNPSYIFRRLEFLATGFFCPGGGPLTARKRPWQDPHIRFFSLKMFSQFAEANKLTVVSRIYEEFKLQGLPSLYKMKSPRGRRLISAASKPFGFLGKTMPSIFSHRQFMVAQK